MVGEILPVDLNSATGTNCNYSIQPQALLWPLSDFLFTSGSDGGARALTTRVPTVIVRFSKSLYVLGNRLRPVTFSPLSGVQVAMRTSCGLATGMLLIAVTSYTRLPLYPLESKNRSFVRPNKCD